MMYSLVRSISGASISRSLAFVRPALTGLNTSKLCYPQFNFSSSKPTKLDEPFLRDILNKINIGSADNKKGILDAGIVNYLKVQQSTQTVTISLRVAKDFVRLKNLIKSKTEAAGFKNVIITLQQKDERKIFQRKGNLSQIGKIIAVSSCKGGVGKSTVAVNIAFTLQQQGFTVGIFDADIYGPSLPTLVNKQGQLLQSSSNNPNNIIPKQVNGVKCMSFGFVSKGSSTIRGPMASSIASQLILQTQWGKLDFLIIDTPPGTGDINLSICEEVKLDGGVIVTTPQKLAFIDVLKGIKMLQDLKVKILGIVENMSFYSCSKCQVRDQIFGKGHLSQIKEQLGIQSAFRLPLVSQISNLSDSGKPAVLNLPQNNIIRKTYDDICASIKKQLDKPKVRRGAFYNTTQRLVIVEEQKIEKKINPVKLRAKCKCSQCYHQINGESIIKESQIDPEIFPVKIQAKGGYAIGINWSDGHKNSIYSFKRLLSQQIPSK